MEVSDRTGAKTFLEVSSTTHLNVHLNIGGHSRSSEIGLRCSEVPGQHFVDARDGQIGDALQHVLQVAFRGDAVELGGADQRVDRRRRVSAGI